MAMNPMQQQMSPDMLMAMMTDPRASPQQRMAAMSALNTMKGGSNASVPPPQMTGDSTGVSTIDPAFMAAVRQEVMGQGPEEQPEIQQRQAAPEAQQDPTTQALMSGAADASRVAAMARGGEVRGYKDGEEVVDAYAERMKGSTGSSEDLANFFKRLSNSTKPINRSIYEAIHGENSYDAESRRMRAISGGPSLEDVVQAGDSGVIERIAAGRAMAASRAAGAPYDPVQVSGDAIAPLPEEPPPQEPMPPLRDVMQRPPAPMQNFDMPLPPAPEVNIEQAAEQEKPARTGGKDYYALLEKMAEEGDDGVASKKDNYTALLQFGLKTLAEASQPGAKFLGSIGQGGLMGVEGLQQARAARAQDRMKKMTLYGTLAGRQDASEARADALEQRKAEKIAERQFRKDEGTLTRDAAGERLAESLAARKEIAAPLAAIAQQNADAAAAAKTAAAVAAQEKLDNPKMSAKMEGAVQTYTQTGMNSNAEAISAENLANRFETETPSSGFFGGMGKVWKQFTGNEDYVSQLRNEYTHFKNTGIISFLPKGASSDKDVVFASAGFLPDTADPKIIAQWLRGHAKLKKYESELSYANAEFLSKNRDMGVTKRDLNINGIDVKKGTSYPSFMKNYLSQVSVPGVEYDKNPSEDSGTTLKPGGTYNFDSKGNLVSQ